MPLLAARARYQHWSIGGVTQLSRAIQPVGALSAETKPKPDLAPG